MTSTEPTPLERRLHEGTASPFEQRLWEESRSESPEGPGMAVRTYLSRLAIMESLGHSPEYAAHLNAMTNKKSKEGKEIQSAITKIKEKFDEERKPEPVKGILQTSRLKSKIARDNAMRERLRRVHGTETGETMDVLFEDDNGKILRTRSDTKEKVKQQPLSKYEKSGLSNMAKEKRKQQRSAERIKNRMAGMGRLRRKGRALRAWAEGSTQDRIYRSQDTEADNSVAEETPTREPRNPRPPRGPRNPRPPRGGGGGRPPRPTTSV